MRNMEVRGIKLEVFHIYKAAYRSSRILKHTEDSTASRGINTEPGHILRQSDLKKNSLTSRSGC